MPHSNSVTLVQAWQDAANTQNVDRLIALSDPNIEIVGPRGSGYGHQLLREWLGRAGLRLETLRVFARGDAVVVEQHGVWHSVETGEVVGERDIASRFRVDGERIVQFARYDSLNAALAEAGLTFADEKT
jgi:limonene-1,2-epoxide hydrolase